METLKIKSPTLTKAEKIEGLKSLLAKKGVVVELPKGSRAGHYEILKREWDRLDAKDRAGRVSPAALAKPATKKTAPAPEPKTWAEKYWALPGAERMEFYRQHEAEFKKEARQERAAKAG